MPRLEGSIYEGKSLAGQRALADLRVILQRAGFYAEKERTTECTLRVYPERRGKYPLLNPRFQRGRDMGRWKAKGPTLVCFVFSDGDATISRALSDFRSIHGCTYLPEESRVRSYYLHGQYLIGLSFVGSPRAQQVDFESLFPVFSELHLQLSGIHSLLPYIHASARHPPNAY
jgi:hypothetical protein